MLKTLSPAFQPQIRPYFKKQLIANHKVSRRSLVVLSSQEESGNLSTIIGATGVVANPLLWWSLFSLKTTGEGLPPGPGGLLGAAEGLSYLLIVGIVGWSAVTKVQSGSGLPSGKFGLLGASEGLSYLTLVAAIVVFGLQILEKGSLPGIFG
eukprot:TRINITY_DN7152_c0_g1_i8.p2 TRINITY_DN7152_c0_g1~~TRINITY_DN7152_c0_g1_i8.p2  ORF type:complete len:152 (-),score=20.36 TRINITY_DN7152_c0_g1_i8:220-675(-)